MEIDLKTNKNWNSNARRLNKVYGYMDKRKHCIRIKRQKVGHRNENDSVQHLVAYNNIIFLNKRKFVRSI